jgi:hypothetical protein
MPQIGYNTEKKAQQTAIRIQILSLVLSCYYKIMKIIKNSFIDAGLAVIYIAAASLFMASQDKIIGNETLSIMMMLLLLVISVAMMGILIFGKPVIWYLDGKKKEALELVGYTIGFLVFILAIAALTLNALSIGIR